MQSKILVLIVISFLSVTTINGQDGTKKVSPVGTWNFENPNAPEGYTSGTIVVGFAEMKYTISIVFTVTGYKFTGEKVKFGNDSLFFSIFPEGQDVAVSLKMVDKTKMSGKAVYSEGELPLSLTKVTTPVTDVKK